MKKTIPIIIGDIKINTWIDEEGTQRLPNNPVYSALIHSGALDLNKLAASYFKNQITFEHYLEFYLNIDYSVSAFSELSLFEHLEIKNPLWDKK